MPLRFPTLVLTLLFSALLVPALRAQGAWTVGTTGLVGSNHIISVTYGNGRFVGATTAGTQPGIITSRDGTTWAYAATQVASPFQVAFANNTFFALGRQSIWRSVDGIEWTQIYTPSQPSGLSSANYMATSGTSMMLTTGATADTTFEFSPDLRTWRRTSALPNTVASSGYLNVLNLLYFRGRYFVIYDAGASVTTSSKYAASSTDGVTWTSHAALAGAQTMAASDDRLLGLRGSDLVATTDGTTFTTTTAPTTIWNFKLVHAGGRFFALQNLVSSRDGATWAPLATYTPASEVILYSAAFGNGRFVVGGLRMGSGGSLSFRDVVCGLAASGPPTFSVPPAASAIAEGRATTLSAALDVTDSGTTYRWFRDGVVIAGATGATFTIPAMRAADAGRYSVEARNSLGTSTSDIATLTLAPPTVAPFVVLSPTNGTRIAGQSTTLTVTAGGTAPFTYQWSRNGVAIPGATAASLTLTPVLADAGDYTVTITNSAGSATSATASLVVNPVSRISNLSVLTGLSAGNDFTLGYVIGGATTTGQKPVVLRAVGPSLAAFAAGAIDDPRFETYAGPTKTGENDNWGGATTLANAIAAVGAFPLSGPASRDAAVATTLSAGDNSVKVLAVGNSAGLVLAEVYDASADATFTTATPRLLNVSVLKPLGTGFTVGFTIAGTAPKSVVIRAIGPTLAGFGVGGPAADPQLTLYDGKSVKIGENDNWGGSPALAVAFTGVGAFTLPANSKDAALLTELPPGGYSVAVSSVGSTSGTALVEVYEVP